MIKTEPTYQISIYIAGDYDQARQACKHYCTVMCPSIHGEGLCVTVTKTSFIYTGGEEFGVCVGLLNYPRFPVSSQKLTEITHSLADYLLNTLYQKSVLIVDPNGITTWKSNKEE